MRLALERLIVWYLNWQLNRGRHEHVYNLSQCWGTSTTWMKAPFYNAVSTIQARLIKDFGYHECWSCYWATKYPQQHMIQGSWCWEQFQPHHPQKFYMLERDTNDGLRQLGIVVAPSVEDAATKVHLTLVSVVRPPESAKVCAELENGYWLIQFDEIIHQSPAWITLKI